MNAIQKKRYTDALEFIEAGMADIRKLLAEDEEKPPLTYKATAAPPIQLDLPDPVTERNGRYIRTPATPIPSPVQGEREYISLPEAIIEFDRSNGWFVRRIESGEIKARLHPNQKPDSKRKHYYVCRQDCREIRARGERYPGPKKA